MQIPRCWLTQRQLLQPETDTTRSSTEDSHVSVASPQTVPRMVYPAPSSIPFLESITDAAFSAAEAISDVRLGGEDDDDILCDSDEDDFGALTRSVPITPPLSIETRLPSMQSTVHDAEDEDDSIIDSDNDDEEDGGHSIGQDSSACSPATPPSTVNTDPFQGLFESELKVVSQSQDFRLRMPAPAGS